MNLEILKIASNTENHKVIKNHTHYSKNKNPICGDEMHISLIIKDDQVIDFGYQCKSCIFCQASVSLLSRKVIKLALSDVSDLLKQSEFFFSEKEKIITKERIDFAQFNYSLQEREAEKRLLPICKERGVATLINRPFMRGKLFKAVARKKLPSWAYEYNINTWSQFFLKFILANPAVTTIIPATSDPAHMVDNLNGGIGLIPKMGLQKKMVEIVED